MGQLNTSKVRVGNITRVNPISWICPFLSRWLMFVRSAVYHLSSICDKLHVLASPLDKRILSIPQK